MRPFSRIEDEPDADGLSLVATFQGTEEAPWPEDAIETNVRVVDGIAYLTSIADGLRIVDVSDPATPTEVGYFEAQADYYNDLKIVDGPGATRYALVAANDGVLVIDVTDPQAPTLVTVFSVPGMDFGMHTLFTEIVGGTTYAYIVDGATSLLGIFDITDPASPAMAGTFTIENEFGNIHDLFVEDGRVYLNAGLDGLIVVDTQPDPTTPVQVGQFLPAEPAYSHSNWVTTAGGRKISAHGDEGADTGLTIVDVDEASPEFMQPIGSFYLPNGASIHNIMAFGDRAYVAWYQNGVRVLDLSDPTNPTQVAHYNTWEAERGIRGLFDGTLGIDVDLAAGLIYAADTQLGLVILSIDQ
jgi:hypothetical protein